MKSDQQFNIFFVKAVEKHEILYNSSLKDYSNKDEQEKAWGLVASEVEESISSCKDRWKNLRASLCRHLRNQSLNGSEGNNLKRPYYLFDYLQFVVPYTKNRSQPKAFSRPNTTPTEEIEDDPGPLKEVNEKEEGWLNSEASPQQYLQMTEGQSSPSSSANTPTWRKKQHKLIHSPKEDYANHFLLSKKSRPEEHFDDADVSFLKSLLPDIKKMNDRQRNQFKRMVLEAIDEILYDQSTTTKVENSS